jgi:hypothetical protein
MKNDTKIAPKNLTLEDLKKVVGGVGVSRADTIEAEEESCGCGGSKTSVKAGAEISR